VIPPLDENGYLPPGVHAATWSEVVERFGYTPYRLRLLNGLRAAIASLAAAGCKSLYLDGSFVTGKRIPADYDACWDPFGVELRKVDPVLRMFDAGRAAQKAKFGGELFPSTAKVFAAGATFLDFFQWDREGVAKGVIVVDLRSFTA
jgi:hypothetical protein